jgi:hypothetical protein
MAATPFERTWLPNQTPGCDDPNGAPSRAAARERRLIFGAQGRPSLPAPTGAAACPAPGTAWDLHKDAFAEPGRTLQTGRVASRPLALLRGSGKCRMQRCVGRRLRRDINRATCEHGVRSQLAIRTVLGQF